MDSADIAEIEASHEELWNLRVWPQPRPGDQYVCVFYPRENILMRLLRKLRIVKPAALVSGTLVATDHGRVEEPQSPERDGKLQSDTPESRQYGGL